MSYVDPRDATPEDVANAEDDRPGHTCQDDFIPGLCPACNRLEWIEKAEAALQARRQGGAR